MNGLLDLAGKKGLILGVANAKSIAYGCAKVMQRAGAELAVTFLNAKAEPHVRPLAEDLRSPIILPCDVEQPGQLEAVFAAMQKLWGRIDFAVHSIAFAPKDDLHGRVVDCSREGFARAVDISCHSFIRMARLAESLMPQGGCLITMSYHGAREVIPHYNLMGPIKAALETVVKYLAAELGGSGIRVHALSPGPLETRAGSGIEQFHELMEAAVRDAPLHHLVSIEDVGALAAFLCSDAARSITGNVAYVDSGHHVVG